MRFFAMVASVVLGAVIVSNPAFAQQKTAKACQQEWRANKAANQAAGVTEKAYVAQCRMGASPTTQAPAAPSATAPIQAEPAAPAQQKTAKACQQEWRANKAANQAAGVTEKAYVAQCRSGASPTTQAPAAPSATAPIQAEPAAPAQQKTAKACQQEWRANKAANQAAGVTEKAYVAQCRMGASPTTQAPAAPSATAPIQAPMGRVEPAAPAQPTAPPVSTSASGANEFTSEAQAKARCPAETVVWANLPSKIYHFAGAHNYGHTKSGAYMCEQDAQSAGMRAAKNEKHP